MLGVIKINFKKDLVNNITKGQYDSTAVQIFLSFAKKSLIRTKNTGMKYAEKDMRG